MDQNKKPILVTGSARSGTTWVGSVLSKAPKVHYIHEPFNYIPYHSIKRLNVPNWFQYINHKNEILFYNDIKKVLNFGFNIDYESINHKLLIDYAYISKSFIGSIFYRLVNYIPLLKDPIAFFSTPWLVEKFNFDVVIMIRHPAAFVSSIKCLNWSFNFHDLLNQPLLMHDYLEEFKDEIEFYIKKNNQDIIYESALVWKIFYTTVIKFKSQFPDWNYIRHEDLSQNPMDEFKALYSKLNLNFTLKTRHFISESCLNNNSSDQILSNPYSIKRNSISNIYYWKTRLNDEEIYKIKKLVENISSHFYSDEEW